MSINKAEQGWLVDEQPGGRGGKRFRKTFKTQAEAKQYQAWLKTKVTAEPDWKPERPETRRLTELVSEWFLVHGSTLRSGEDQRKRLEAMALAVGNPIADRFTADTFANYRTKRLAEGITPTNCNREHTYTKALFNILIGAKKWSKSNPMADLKMFKGSERELHYLDSAQIDKLLSSLAASSNKHVLLCTKLALSTGARWSEAEQLRKTQVRGGLVQYSRTKTDKNRSVPISDELSAELHEHFKKHGAGGRFFEYCEGAFREGIERAEIELPDGQMTHVLRHTFASHFMMNGGSIVTLQRVLGHKSVKTTMQYAHLAPGHLAEVLALNPLAKSRAAASDETANDSSK